MFLLQSRVLLPKPPGQPPRTCQSLLIDLESDPVASWFLSSLAAPGGNLTGLFLNLPDLAAKWLQLLPEVVPETRRVAVLWDITTGRQQLAAFTAAATAIFVELHVLEFAGATGLENALSTKPKGPPDALIELGSPLINQWSDRIAKFSAEFRLPAISPFRSFVEAGGLMSYGPNLPIMFRRGLTSYVSKVLKGAKAANLPVEQPTHFELVINVKTARAPHLTGTPALLARAGEVIE